MARLFLLIALLAALAAVPAGAAPQANPFLPAAPQVQPSQIEEAPAQQPAQAPAAQTDGGISNSTLVALLIGVGVLLTGIWVAITRDARRATVGRVRTRTSRVDDPFEVRQGRAATRAAPKSRKLSAAERKRRKRGRAR